MLANTCRASFGTDSGLLAEPQSAQTKAPLAWSTNRNRSINRNTRSPQSTAAGDPSFATVDLHSNCSGSERVSRVGRIIAFSWRLHLPADQRPRHGLSAKLTARVAGRHSREGHLSPRPFPSYLCPPRHPFRPVVGDVPINRIMFPQALRTQGFPEASHMLSRDDAIHPPDHNQNRKGMRHRCEMDHSLFSIILARMGHSIMIAPIVSA